MDEARAAGMGTERNARRRGWLRSVRPAPDPDTFTLDPRALQEGKAKRALCPRSADPAHPMRRLRHPVCHRRAARPAVRTALPEHRAAAAVGPEPRVLRAQLGVAVVWPWAQRSARFESFFPAPGHRGVDADAAPCRRQPDAGRAVAADPGQRPGRFRRPAGAVFRPCGGAGLPGPTLPGFTSRCRARRAWTNDW